MPVDLHFITPGPEEGHSLLGNMVLALRHKLAIFQNSVIAMTYAQEEDICENQRLSLSFWDELLRGSLISRGRHQSRKPQKPDRDCIAKAATLWGKVIVNQRLRWLDVSCHRRIDTDIETGFGGFSQPGNRGRRQYHIHVTVGGVKGYNVWLTSLWIYWFKSILLD